MKVGFVYGPFCLGGSEAARRSSGFDFSNIWSDSRGLTGSELSFFRISQELARRGHDVHLFTLGRGPLPSEWEGLSVHDFDTLLSTVDGTWDAVCSWNEAEVFRGMNPDPLRVCNLQINDFVHCRPFFHDIVDVFTSPSGSHRQMVLSREAWPVHLRHGDPGYVYKPDPSRWAVLTNGCDPDRYPAAGTSKVRGRVIWASSPDRGLHWLLQEWPKIRHAAPWAHLKIFYKVHKWVDGLVDNTFPDPSIQEQRRRALYIREALRRLDGHGVELVDCVSRVQIDREMSEAQVLAYSCDPVSWTEGFSVTLMEACAAGSCPVTTAVDALPEIYGEHVPMVRVPVRDHIGDFSDIVVRALTDDSYRSGVNVKARELALRYTWASLAERLEGIIAERLSIKRQK